MGDSLAVVNNYEVASVMDKALDMGSAAIAKLAEMVEQTAPKLWEIAIKQVYVDAIGDVLVALVIMAGFFTAGFVINKLKKYTETRDGRIGCDVGKWICYIMGLFIFVIALINSVTLLQIYMNPEYYAIKLILEMAGI